MLDYVYYFKQSSSLNINVNIYFSITKAPTCTTDEPLVGGATPIPDSYMTASSVYAAHRMPFNARINGTSAWCASTLERDATEPNMYLQVSLCIVKLGCVVVAMFTVHSLFIPLTERLN